MNAVTSWYTLKCAIPNNVADHRIENLREYCRRNARRITPRNSISSSTGAATQVNKIDSAAGANKLSSSSASSALIGNSCSTNESIQPVSNANPGTMSRIGADTSVIVAATECLAGWNSSA